MGQRLAAFALQLQPGETRLSKHHSDPSFPKVILSTAWLRASFVAVLPARLGTTQSETTAI
jgi:hypothetical protein